MDFHVMEHSGYRGLRQIYTSRDLFKSKYVAYKKIQEASKVLIILKGAKFQF